MGKQWKQWETLFSCSVGEYSWESLDCKEIKPVNPKGNQSWIFIGRTDAEALILWSPVAKSQPWCCKRLKAGGEGDDRGWDGWMASLTQWTWVWASSGRWWRTGNPGVLQSMGLQKVGDDWQTEWQQWRAMPHWRLPISVSSRSPGAITRTWKFTSAPLEKLLATPAFSYFSSEAASISLEPL